MSEQGFKGIPGVPDGWKLVRIGVPSRGDKFLNTSNGEITTAYFEFSLCWLPIVRKIEKPKKYRPFASAEEFKPHRDRWWSWKEDPNEFNPPCCYSGKFHGAHGWSISFDEKVFDDGTPFGVEVIE